MKEEQNASFWRKVRESTPYLGLCEVTLIYTSSSNPLLEPHFLNF